MKSWNKHAHAPGALSMLVPLLWFGAIAEVPGYAHDLSDADEREPSQTSHRGR
jgi:hypothetical protein